MNKTWQRGDKVYARIAGKNVPALVLSTEPSGDGGEDAAMLKIGIWSSLDCSWRCFVYPVGLPVTKLIARRNKINRLDFE